MLPTSEETLNISFSGKGFLYRVDTVGRYFWFCDGESVVCFGHSIRAVFSVFPLSREAFSENGHPIMADRNILRTNVTEVADNLDHVLTPQPTELPNPFSSIRQQQQHYALPSITTSSHACS